MGLLERNVGKETTSAADDRSPHLFDSNRTELVASSKLFDSPHQLAKLLEQIAAVVRSRGGFGVVLHAEEGIGAVAHAFEGVVVEVDVRRLQIAQQGIGADREAVILGGDFHAVAGRNVYGARQRHHADDDEEQEFLHDEAFRVTSNRIGTLDDNIGIMKFP